MSLMTLLVQIVMRIPLDKNSSEPLYRQIELFLAEQIEGGALAADTRLPSSRQLADLLGVSRIVIANAYAELESLGFVYSRRGSGTFVAPLYTHPPEVQKDFISAQDWPLWQQELYTNTWSVGHQELDRLLGTAKRHDTISFAQRTNNRDPLWPVEDFRKVFNKVMRQAESVMALGLNNFAGHRPLREAIAQLLNTEGIPARVDDVLITSGSQQALSLVARVLLKPGDLVLVESPTYNVAIDLFRSMDVRLLGIPVDEQGMQVDKIEKLVQSTPPRLIYTIPTFHDPTGTCMSGSRRRYLLSLADQYNIPILEDDYIGSVRFEGRAEPALKALDPGGRVIYIGTFSKILMPSLRLGFLVASGPIFERLSAAKYVTDLSTSSLVQRVLAEYLTVGRYHAHIRRITQSYRERRDRMVSALERYLPEETRWLTPKGGATLWLQLPHDLSADDLFPYAAEEGVTFVPGSFFYPGQRPQSNLPLNFAINSPDAIEEGVKRLGRALTRFMQMSAQTLAK